MKALYYRTPQRFRRNLYRIISPRSFHRLQRERSEGGKYKPFDERRAIFVHIPKCAGTAVCRTLFGQDKVTHRSVAKYQLIFSPEEFNSYFKFTVVRNPWDRLVSAYHFMKGGGGTSGDQKWAEKYLLPYANFDTFVTQALRLPEVQSRHYFRPQYSYICLPGSTQPLVDYIGRVENLQQALDHICSQLGMDQHQIQRVNTSQRGNYQEYFNSDTRDIASQVYAEDLQLFGYEY